MRYTIEAEAKGYWDEARAIIGIYDWFEQEFVEGMTYETSSSIAIEMVEIGQRPSTPLDKIFKVVKEVMNRHEGEIAHLNERVHRLEKLVKENKDAR